MHELYPDCELVWALQDFKDEYHLLPEYIKVVKPETLDYYREFATAACYVTNEGIDLSVYKRKGQYFVQTWHGDRGFKESFTILIEQRSLE